MRRFGLCLCVLFFSFSTSYAQQPSPTTEAVNLSGSWDMQLMDKHHKVIATMTVSFSNQAANSCMSGSWKQMAVSRYKTEDPDFFPGREPLAYALDGDYVSMGRMEVCDGYLMLGGKLTGNRVQGEYSAVSIGGSQLLGYFEAKRNP